MTVIITIMVVHFLPAVLIFGIQITKDKSKQSTSHLSKQVMCGEQLQEHHHISFNIIISAHHHLLINALLKSNGDALLVSLGMIMN